MNKQEKIERFKQQIAQLTKELKEFEAMQDEFKVGDWVIRECGYRAHPLIARINNMPNDGLLLTGLDHSNQWHDKFIGCMGFRIEKVRKATPSEIESALRSEWNRRFKEAGWDSGDEAEIEDHAESWWNGRRINDLSFSLSYDVREDSLYSLNGTVYHQGKWATPIPRKNVVTINGYEANFEHDGRVKFGCAMIDRDLINDIHSMMIHNYKGNRTIQSVKIGDGTFSADDIKAITERL